MDQSSVTSTLLDNRGYTAEMTGDRFTIRGRSIPVGHLELEDGMWLAIGHAIRLAPSAEAASYAEPEQALKEFLHREGYLTEE